MEIDRSRAASAVYTDGPDTLRRCKSRGNPDDPVVVPVVAGLRRLKPRLAVLRITHFTVRVTAIII